MPRESTKESLASKQNLLDEIVTRKDTCSIAAAMHKRHMSVYNHIRMMHKRGSQGPISGAAGTGACFDSLAMEKLADPVNNDLDCVVAKKEKTSRGTRKHLSSK